MSQRLEVELTSSSPDMWTWRAAGAKQPKGEIPAKLVYDGAKVGDVTKADAEFDLDGIHITKLFKPEKKDEQKNIIELKPRKLDKSEQISVVKPKTKKIRNKKERFNKTKPTDPKPRTPRKPRPLRLKPARINRDVLIDQTEVEHRPIVEQLLQNGIPGVRSALKKQSDEAKKAGKAEIDPAPLLTLAENLLPKAKTAEWLDKAEAAQKILDKIDLRDLRSVVVSGKSIAKSGEPKKLLDELTSILDERIETDHQEWVTDLTKAIEEERTITALKISSRPVKAGSPLPAELATQLSLQTSQALNSETEQYRWGVMLDALAHSPVRSAVVPVSLPAAPNEELIVEVRRLSDKIPNIAKLFGVNPADVPTKEKKQKPNHLKNPRKNKKDEKTESKGSNRSKDKGKRRNKKDDKPKKFDPSKTKADIPRPGTIIKEEPKTDDQESESNIDSSPDVENSTLEENHNDQTVLDVNEQEQSTDENDSISDQVLNNLQESNDGQG